MCNLSEGFWEAGRKEGLKEGRKELILEALTNGSDPEDIAKILHIDISYVLEVQNE